MAAHIDIGGTHPVFGVRFQPLKAVGDACKRLRADAGQVKPVAIGINAINGRKPVCIGGDDCPFGLACQHHFIAAPQNIAAVTPHSAVLFRPCFHRHHLRDLRAVYKIDLRFNRQPKKTHSGHIQYSAAKLSGVNGCNVHKKPEAFGIA